MAIALRRAVAADADALLPWIGELNRSEGIATAEANMRRALARLLADDALGRVWWIDGGRDTGAIGYAIVTFGWDLEWGGRDAYLTELYLVPAARGRGAGTAAVDAIVAAMPALEVAALHVMVRPDNAAALASYRGAGFDPAPRAMLTRVIAGTAP
jgi:ribosomal protein S18 acetylase RimI-like enzyme